jgi:hypothetical protein
MASGLLKDMAGCEGGGQAGVDTDNRGEPRFRYN